MNHLHLTKPETMKLARTLCLFLFSFCLLSTQAAEFPKAAPSPKIGASKVSIREVEKLMGKKMTLLQKIEFKLLQYKLRRMKGDEPMTEKQKKQAQASMILGIASFVFLLLASVAVIGFLGIFSLPAAILAVIFGAKSLKGNSNSQGIIGVVFGGLTLLLFVLAIILIAIAFAGFGVG
jgi:hypothetical protein